MAKKSAKSKGYRKQTGKKPYLSKRDIALLCVLVAAVVVAAILLFRYDDGALKMQDGAVVTEGDNWLIVNGASRGGRRYFKLGEAGELAGFSREASPSDTDANLPVYDYASEAEDAPIQSVQVLTSHSEAARLAPSAAARFAAMDGVETGEVQTVEIGDITARYFIFASSPAEEEAAVDEAEPTEEAEAAYHRELCGYIDASHNSCVVFRVDSGADTLEACADDAALLDLFTQAVGAVTLDEGK